MKILLLAVILGLVVSFPANSPVAKYGKLKVNGIHLVSESGKIVQLRGVSTHGPQWFEYCYTYDSFKAIAQVWKADIIRIAMYVTDNGYNVKPDYWKQKIGQYVDWTEQLGIYIIIDWHILVPGDPLDPSYNNKWDFWGYISSVYKSKKHVLYEICNEPNGNGVDWARIETYAIPMVTMIRSVDPDTIIIVGTPFWSQELWNVKPLAFKNIMYTLHFYSGMHYFQDKIYPEAARLPIFATEFGLSSPSGSTKIDYANLNKWMDLVNGKNAGGQKISFINWSWSECNEELSALKVDSCKNKQWTATSESGQWVMKKLQEAH